MFVDNVDGDAFQFHKILGEMQLYFCVNISSELQKRVRADLLEFALPEIAEVVSGGRNFKTDAKSVGRQTWRKQLGSDSKKWTASRVIPTKYAKQISRSRRDLFTSISH